MKSFNIIAVITFGLSISSYGQTNRINHYSHSGNQTTLSIFKANDNMGLNCGTPYNQEYTPPASSLKVLEDSTKLDSTKPKVCTPKNIQSSENPRRGLSLERKFNAEDVLGKF